MQIVQDALKDTGIPAFADARRATQQAPTAPDQYIVYTTMTLEAEHWDDAPRRLKVYVYLNLWSRTDPTDAVRAVRKAMRKAGFGMVQEIDSYEDSTGYILVACTWVITKEDADGTSD